MISIIIPVYNVEQYLSNCIDSVLNQTYSDFELILVNNDSPDRSGEICDTYALKDARIKVIHQQNGGQSSARNTGLETAKGEYITFIDSDDTVDPHFLQILLDALKEYPQADLSICGCEFVAESRTTFEPLPKNIPAALLLNKEQLWDEVFGHLNNSVCNKLYKKELIGHNRFPLGIYYGEDLLFNLHYLQNCSHATINPLGLYFYFKRSGSVTGGKFNKNRFTELKSKDAALKIVESAAPEQIGNAKKYCFKARISIIRILYKEHLEQPYEAELSMCKQYLNSHYTAVKKMLNIKEKLEFFLIKFSPLYRFTVKLIQ